MNEEQKYEVPKQGKADIAHTLVKAAISGAPVIGGPGAEIFALVIAPPLQKRQAEWMNEVADGLRQVEKKVDGFNIENLRDNERFISAVMNASHAAIRNHEQDKRDALRNAVLNVAIGSGLTEDVEAIFLALIDRYTAWHLRILRVFQDPLNLGAQKEIRPENYSLAGSRAAFLERYYPEMRDNQQFYGIIVSDLRANGMLSADLSGMITPLGMFQKITTEWADQFLAFIALPV
jgi:hypothetical protein